LPRVAGDCRESPDFIHSKVTLRFRNLERPRDNARRKEEWCALRRYRATVGECFCRDYRRHPRILSGHRRVEVDGVEVFFREAGPTTAPHLLLLHGFPTSSHMFRHLVPALADRYHVVAPDLPGFGFSDAPDRRRFRYTFEHLSEIISRFTEVTGLDRFAVYVFGARTVARGASSAECPARTL
jgi:alpha/beta hydrolase fold